MPSMLTTPAIAETEAPPPSAEAIHYISAREARSRLRVGRDLFARLMNSGRVRTLTYLDRPPRYHAADVEALVREALRAPSTAAPSSEAPAAG